MKRRFQNWLRRQLPEPRIVAVEMSYDEIVLRRSDGMIAKVPMVYTARRWCVNVPWVKPKDGGN